MERMLYFFSRMKWDGIDSEYEVDGGLEVLW